MTYGSPRWQAGQEKLPARQAAWPVTSARTQVMSVEDFLGRDTEYLGWVVAHTDGCMINIGRVLRGYAWLQHTASQSWTSYDVSAFR